MRYRELHAWNLSVSEAVALQQELRTRVEARPLDKEVRVVAGADISFDKYSDTLFAAFVVLDLSTLQIIDSSGVVSRVTFPYVPGLLSFRELPPLLEAWSKLTTAPDVVFLDGQGIAHPRRFGVASHFGLIAELPSIGCAKTLLTGKYIEPAEDAGASSPLIDRGEQVGAILRTKKRVKPVYVSVGHLIDLESACKLTMRCVRGYRIPEPTRQAHLLVNEMRRGRC